MAVLIVEMGGNQNRNDVLIKWSTWKLLIDEVQVVCKKL